MDLTLKQSFDSSRYCHTLTRQQPPAITKRAFFYNFEPSQNASKNDLLKRLHIQKIEIDTGWIKELLETGRNIGLFKITKNWFALLFKWMYIWTIRIIRNLIVL